MAEEKVDICRFCGREIIKRDMFSRWIHRYTDKYECSQPPVACPRD